MKKLIAICAVALSVGAFAADSYLYWMVEDSITWAEGTATPTPTYTAARVGVTSAEGTTTYLSLYNENGTSVGGSSISLGDTAYPMYAYAGVGETYQAASYSFFIELLNDTSVVGTSSSLAGNALTSYMTSSLGGTSVPAAGAWNGGTFTATAAIPEPTSGLLMLFGLAGLALRRKRMAKQA